MATMGEFLRITEIEGVKDYILVRNDGEIAARNVSEPEAMARLVLSCGSGPEKIGTKRYRYQAFRRRGGEDFFIFPLGNYYFGVVKYGDTDGALLVARVLEFIKTLLRK